MNKFYLLFLVFMIPIFGYSQISDPNYDPKKMMQQNADKIEEVKSEIKSKGITEAELNAKLLDKGYNLKQLRPDQIEGMDKVVEEAIKEIEEEKIQASNKAKETEKTKINKEQNDPKKLNKEEGLKKAKQADKDKKTVKLDDFDFQNDFSKSIEETFEIDPNNKQKEAKMLSDSLKDLEKVKVAIYGQQLFLNSDPEYFTNPQDQTPANDYLLGPGDVVRIVIFGRSLYDGDLEVDDQGYIDPKTLPKIYLKSLPWGQAKKLIEARYKQRYSFSTGEIAISLKKSRSITVSVFGEVRNPGSFTSSAANTAYNLIVLAKGITDLGSVRNIQIVSPGGGIKIYDVYKSMMNPTLATNIYLQNNDFVQVPVAQKVVSVIGAIVRPYRYELLSTENLGDLIKYAGGYAADADKELIQIIRFENGSRKIYEVSAANAKSFIPQNGDEITVIQSSEEVKNRLEVSGDVERPGNFEWKEGMKVTDLLDKAKLKRTTKRNIGFVQSLNSDNSYSLRSFNIDSITEDKNSTKNYLLSPNDKLIILSQIDFTQYYKINVSGAVRNPGEFDFDPAKNIKVKDAVTLAGGLKVDALSKAYVVRTDTATGLRNYALFNIQNALTDINSSDNFIMEPLDRIVILSNSIIKNESTVSVGGAVKNPGQFKYGYSMTLLDAITLSGGLKTEAATNRVEIFRIVLNNNEPTKVVAATFDIPRDLIMATDALNKTYLEPFDIIEVRSLPKYSLQKMIKIEGEVRYPGSYALIKDNETIYEVIGRAGGLNPEAFLGGAKLNRSFDNIGLVIIQLGDIMKNPNASYNISLSDGDILTIPKNKELVSIAGAVNIGDITNAAELNNDYKINVAYMSGRNVKYYIDEFAGGLSDNADKSKIYVQDANGKKSKVKSFLFFKKYPKVNKGSAIVVGYKDEKLLPIAPREKTDWAKVIAESVAQATAILTLVVLINTINKS